MNTQKISTSFQNLIPLETYSYELETIRSNWPVTASALSGSFSPIKTDYDIVTHLNFCASSGVCASPDILPYSPENCSLDNVPFIELRIKLNLPYADKNIYGPIQRLECETCIQHHKLVSVDSTSNEVDGSFTISAGLTDLVAGRSYSYIFESLGGNYPIYLSDVSGVFVPESTSHSIKADANFCCPSGSCNGTVFDKTHDTVLGQTRYLQHKIRLKTTDTCSDSIKYKDIVLQYNKIDPTFSLPSDITLSRDSKGCTKLNIALNDCLTDHTYHYQYKVKDSNWPIYLSNISGVINNTANTADISTKIAFCPSSGICSGSPNVFDSTVPLLDTKINNYCSTKEYYASLYIEVVPSCYPENTALTSNIVTVYCKDCLDSPSISLSQP